MTKTEYPCLPEHLLGAYFLLPKPVHGETFTPEDASPEDRQMALSAARFMGKDVLPQLEALERQESGVARRLFDQAGALGLLAIEIPEAYGGLGLGKVAALGVNEQLSRLGGFGITCGAHSGIGSQPLVYFGTKRQKEKYLPRLATGEWMAAYCLSEADSGSDALAMRTRASLSPDGKHYVLNGVKMWITNAAWADLFTVFAKVDGKHVTAFLVEKTFAGVSTGKEEHKLGLKSSSTRRVILEDVLVPVENVLGEVGKGAYIAFNILNFGRYSLGAGIMGSAKEQLRMAAKYAQERRQFGKPLRTFGLIQQKLVDMAAKIYAGESASYRTAGLIDEVMASGQVLELVCPPFPRALDEFALECSIVKVRCSEILFEVADESLQVHGGYGFTEEYSPARALRDSRINRIFEGTNEINRLFLLSLLVRREQRGRFPLGLAMTAARCQLEDNDVPADSGDALTNALSLMGRVKLVLFHLCDLALKKYGDAFLGEQELIAELGNIVSDIYLGESAVLRAIKASKRESADTLGADLAMRFMHERVPCIERSVRRVAEAIAGRAEFQDLHEKLRGQLMWPEVNSPDLRQRIMKAIDDRVGYPVGIQL